MAKCCEGQTTPYCPECGSLLIDDDILGLIKHCENAAKTIFSKIVRADREDADLPTSWKDRLRPKLLARAERWARWTKIVRSLLPEAKP